MGETGIFTNCKSKSQCHFLDWFLNWFWDPDSEMIPALTRIKSSSNLNRDYSLAILIQEINLNYLKCRVSLVSKQI